MNRKKVILMMLVSMFSFMNMRSAEPAYETDIYKNYYGPVTSYGFKEALCWVAYETLENIDQKLRENEKSDQKIDIKDLKFSVSRDNPSNSVIQNLIAVYFIGELYDETVETGSYAINLLNLQKTKNVLERFVNDCSEVTSLWLYCYWVRYKLLWEMHLDRRSSECFFHIDCLEECYDCEYKYRASVEIFRESEKLGDEVRGAMLKLLNKEYVFPDGNLKKTE